MKNGERRWEKAKGIRLGCSKIRPFNELDKINRLILGNINT